MNTQRTAVFGGGCFWCTEAIFKRIKGVVRVEPGYAGGQTENPTYHQVCRGDTGHAEVIRVTYDPQKITYGDLVEVFWQVHDPTTLNRQGNDVGTQYRSIILVKNEEERKVAEQSLRKAQSDFKRPIVTEIDHLKIFFPAEDYHYDYFSKNPNQPYCFAVISPKVKHFIEGNPEKLI